MVATQSRFSSRCLYEQLSFSRVPAHALDPRLPPFISFASFASFGSIGSFGSFPLIAHERNASIVRTVQTNFEAGAAEMYPRTPAVQRQ